MKSIIVLQDGFELSSGSSGAAIQSATMTECVNDQTDVAPGAVCAASLDVTIWTPDRELRIQQGDKLVYYREDDSGNRIKVGVFTAEKPTRGSKHVYNITAYDNVVMLDKNVSAWLMATQDSFPMSLSAFMHAVCEECGVEFPEQDIPNGDYSVSAFYADDLTGRQLMQWACQIAGRFARADADGALRLGWYKYVSTGVSADGGRIPANVRLSGETLRTSQQEVYRIQLQTEFYYQDGLSFEDYEVKPIDKVQLRQTTDDVGVIYPPDEESSNAYVIQGNYLLASNTAEKISPIAQSLYALLRGVSYTPARVEIPHSEIIRAGSIVPIVDAEGQSITVYVMTKTTTDGVDHLECTGNPSRDGTSATNEKGYRNLEGRVLEIKSSVDGLYIKAAQLDGKYSEIEQTVDGFKTEVKNDYSTKEELSSGLNAASIDASVKAENAQTAAEKKALELAGEALNSANAATDEKLTAYSTTVQMQSAIEQSANSIKLEVSETYSTKVYVDSAMTSAVDEANSATDGKLAAYSTTVQMQSAIDQSASSIKLEVSETYSTKEYVDNAKDSAVDTANSATDGKLAAYSTTVQMQSAIEQSAKKISLSVKNNGTSSVLTLSYDGTTLSSQNVEISGFVTFSSLSTSGQSTINGDNITTGTISANIASVSSSAGTVKIQSGGLYAYDANGTYRIGLFTASSTNNALLKFKDSGGNWCGDLFGYRDNDIGIVQLNLSENGFFRADRIQTHEIAIGNMKCFCDGYRALNGNAFVYLEGSSRVGCFEKLAIAGAAAQDVRWVWSGTLGGWVLTTATSLN